jgi:serine/threonine-protein kinase
MSEEQRIVELLEQLLATHRSPEEVCAQFPHLLPEVRARWEQVRRMQAQIDAIFPPSERENEEDDSSSSSAPGHHLDDT